MTVSIRIGDCREILRELPDESVHCVVTSPPYWNLRDYGTAKWEGGDAACDHDAYARNRNAVAQPGSGSGAGNGGALRDKPRTSCSCGAHRIDNQLGLEPEFRDYVAAMVAVFREVRRVLRKDGTLWLNLGCSYASGDMNANQSQPRVHVPAYDSDGKALPNSIAVDRACPDCGGELQACSLNHRESSARNSRQNGSKQQRRGTIDRDNEQQDCVLAIRDVSAHAVQQSTSASSNENDRVVSDLVDEALVCRSEQPTFFDDAPLSADNSACTTGTVRNVRPLSSRKWDKAFVCTACGYSTRMYPNFKPKDLINTPFFVAEALRADGWFLRQDIVWSKLNPMPESVTDRCTKAHEYLFLLSKSQRYFYDAEAIKEAVADSVIARANFKVGGINRDASRNDGDIGKRQSFSDFANGRNKRSVWEVATAPFSEAHFATFPPALIEPCIKAGCAIGGTVLDPFAGAGTTGLVADRLQRDAILIELNPDYSAMSERRILGDAPLFVDVRADPYNGRNDFAKSYTECLRVIRERKAAGGEGWEPK